MANVNITSLPVANVIGSSTDYLELSQYTGTAGAPYTSVRVTPTTLITGAVLGSIPAGLEYVLSNAGSVLLTGVQPYVTMPYAATITGASLVASPSGTITVDIWRTFYALFDGGVTHPVVADLICGSNQLSISSGTKTTSNLNNWTLSLNQGDVLAFNISNVGTITQATVSLYLSRLL